MMPLFFPTESTCAYSVGDVVHSLPPSLPPSPPPPLKADNRAVVLLLPTRPANAHMPS